jgi:hypothetical protein
MFIIHWHEEKAKVVSRFDTLGRILSRCMKKAQYISSSVCGEVVEEARKSTFFFR